MRIWLEWACDVKSLSEFFAIPACSSLTQLGAVPGSASLQTLPTGSTYVSVLWCSFFLFHFPGRFRQDSLAVTLHIFRVALCKVMISRPIWRFVLSLSMASRCKNREDGRVVARSDAYYVTDNSRSAQSEASAQLSPSRRGEAHHLPIAQACTCRT